MLLHLRLMYLVSTWSGICFSIHVSWHRGQSNDIESESNRSITQWCHRQRIPSTNRKYLRFVTNDGRLFELLPLLQVTQAIWVTSQLSSNPSSITFEEPRILRLNRKILFCLSKFSIMKANPQDLPSITAFKSILVIQFRSEHLTMKYCPYNLFSSNVMFLTTRPDVLKLNLLGFIHWNNENPTSGLTEMSTLFGKTFSFLPVSLPPTTLLFSLLFELPSAVSC